MATFVGNLNELITTKNEFKSMIRESGTDPGDVFAEYPSYIRAMLESSGSQSLDSSYVTKEYLSQQSYVTNNNLIQNYPNYNYLYSYVGGIEHYLSSGLQQVTPYTYVQENYVSKEDASYEFPSYAYLYTYVDSKVENIELGQRDLVSYTYLYAYVGDAINGIVITPVVDLSDYYTKEEVDGKQFLRLFDLDQMSYVTENQMLTYVAYAIESVDPNVDLSSYATIAYVTEELAKKVDNNVETFSYGLGDVPMKVEKEVLEVLDAAGVITYQTINNLGSGYWVNDLADKVYVSSYVSNALSYVDLSSYVSKTELEDMSYATQLYVADYVDTHAPTVDLSAYVSKVELQGMSYVSQEQLSSNSYINSIKAITDTGLKTYYSNINTTFETHDYGQALTYLACIESSYINPSGEWYSQYYTSRKPGASVVLAKALLGSGANAHKGVYVKGSYALVNGSGNRAWSEYTHAEGVDTGAVGFGSHSEGWKTHAYAEGSHAEGVDTRAKGLYSLAAGNGTETTQYGEAAFGSYNLSESGTLFSVGCGYTYWNETVYENDQLLDDFNNPILVDGEYVYVPTAYRENAITVYNDGKIKIKGVNSYLAEAINSGSSIDLSAYVTKAELSGMSYVTSSDLSSASYVTSSDLSSASYVTSSDLNSASYVTATYLSNHDIIPATDGHYHLGDAAYKYLQIATKYAFVTDELAFGQQKITHQDTAHSLTIVTNTFDRIIFNNSGIIPAANNSYTLGDSSYEYAATYTASIYADNAYLQDTSYSSSIVPKETATYTLGDSTYYYNATYTNSINLTKNNYVNRLYTSGQYSIACEINGGVRYSFMAGSIRPDVSNVDLGTSSNKWQNTYTANLWADNIHNFIWTGTSAQYAVLDNYTTYQIYLIQEA